MGKPAFLDGAPRRPRSVSRSHRSPPSGSERREPRCSQEQLHERIPIVLTDGSVRFLSQSIDQTTDKNLAARANGKVLGEF